jgi:hypothetical protein
MRLISRIAFIVLLALIGWMPPQARAASQQDLEAKVQHLADELDALKAELAQLKAQQQQQGPAAGVVAGTPTVAAPPARSYISTVGGPSFFGYGELNYAHPTGDTAGATADVARFVLGIGYQFDENTTFASELELEHAVSSADDPGEIEVEQAYIERRFNDHLFAKLGLFLMPTGLLNENHEPTRYYGVFRNYVETAIIPTTWREGGVELQGSTDSGLTVNAGITTGFNLNKWDATSADGRESPLGSIHQELAQASAGDLSGFLALNYTGVPGLKAGGSIFTGGASQGRPGVGNAQVTLWEGHLRWTPAQWELSALYARGRISNTAGFNLLTVGSLTPIPESFFGWYGEAAYRAIERGNWGITPFLRYERFNTGSAYADIAMGLTPAGLPDNEVLTGGVNWTIAPGVVIKGDYVEFRRGSGASRFDVGLGYQF